jgi:hypothetical protein
MNKITHHCNICLESNEHTKLIGLTMNEACQLERETLNKTELHICVDCLMAIKVFNFDPTAMELTE